MGIGFRSKHLTSHIYRGYRVSWHLCSYIVTYGITFTLLSWHFVRIPRELSIRHTVHFRAMRWIKQIIFQMQLSTHLFCTEQTSHSNSRYLSPHRSLNYIYIRIKNIHLWHRYSLLDRLDDRTKAGMKGSRPSNRCVSRWLNWLVQSRGQVGFVWKRITVSEKEWKRYFSVACNHCDAADDPVSIS